MNHKNKERRQQDQSKLFVDPSLLEKGFNIDDLIRELKLEVQALGVSAGTILMRALIEAEVKSLVGERYNRHSQFYPWCKQKGYVMVGGQKAPMVRNRVRTPGRRGAAGELQAVSAEYGSNRGCLCPDALPVSVVAITPRPSRPSKKATASPSRSSV